MSRALFIIAAFAAASAFAAEPKAPVDLGIELAVIRAGTFLMGSPNSERWRNADATTGEGPQTKVTINKPFWLAKTETTRVQRGGAWIDPQSKMRCAWRGWSDPAFGSQKGFQEGTVGFRVAVVAE